MSQDAAAEFFKMLGSYSPVWVLAILVSVVLAYQSPKLVREVFAGLRGMKTTKTRQSSTRQPG